MNERTNKPSRPIVVGFGSVPGGTGCTTLAIHAATYAARQGLHTLAISIDPSADMLRRMGVDDDALYIDAHYVKEDRLNLAVMPPEGATYDVRDALPNLGFGGEVQNPEIIILDLGPGMASPYSVRAAGPFAEYVKQRHPYREPRRRRTGYRRPDRKSVV